MDLVPRTEEGKFVEGKSGNPAGRPPKSRNQLAHQKRKLEIAVREGMSAERLYKIISKMADMAERGDVKAARLILDKFISSASADEDATEDKSSSGITIRIENATFAKTHEAPPIDVQVTEIPKL